MPGRTGGTVPGRIPGISEGRIPGGGLPTTGIPTPVVRGAAAATAGAPVVIGGGVAGPEESMLISP